MSAETPLRLFDLDEETGKTIFLPDNADEETQEAEPVDTAAQQTSLPESSGYTPMTITPTMRRYDGRHALACPDD